MGQPRYRLAQLTAQKVLREFGVDSPPIDVEALAQAVGAELRFRYFDGGVSGMVARRPDGTAIIGINERDAKTRQRFTIAHEIGHLLLHRSERLHVDERFPIAHRNHVSSKAIDPHEIEANQFAAELLMPEAFMRRDTTGRILDAEDDEFIQELAARYEVSVQAMTIRLTRFGLLG